MFGANWQLLVRVWPNQSLKLTLQLRLQKSLKCRETNRQHTIQQEISNSKKTRVAAVQRCNAA